MIAGLLICWVGEHFLCTGGAATGLLAVLGKLDLGQQRLCLCIFGRNLLDEIYQLLYRLGIALHQLNSGQAEQSGAIIGGFFEYFFVLMGGAGQIARGGEVFSFLGGGFVFGYWRIVYQRSQNRLDLIFGQGACEFLCHLAVFYDFDRRDALDAKGCG